MTATTLSPRQAQPGVPAVRGLAWVTWRQHRTALAGVLVVLGGLGLFMLFNGLAMHHAYTSLGLDTCGTLDGPSCQSQLTAFQQDYGSWADHLPHLVMLLPGLIGVFAGAPLVARELESGTFRFAWTQARSRVQWIVTKLVLLAVVLTAFALAFSALSTWWYGPFDAITGRMSSSGAYEISGLVFAARTLFGFTLGALLGLLIRRTVPAMAATAAGWVAVVVASMVWLRPLIQKPITVIGAADTKVKGIVPGHHVPFNATVVKHWFQDAAGQHVGFDQLFQQAIVGNGGTPPSPDQFETWMTNHHYSRWVSYRPNGWFWHFQTVEASGYAILAILLAAATVLILRRGAV
jgi:ABC-type transport system involved in multi-copper enzyme maturation permease subunit